MERSPEERLSTAFGRRIESLLKIKGLSQKELATLTGVSEANLSKIIKGKITTSIEVGHLLANKLDVSLDDLLTGGARPIRLKSAPLKIPEDIDEDLLEAVEEYRKKGMQVPEGDIWELALTHSRGMGPGKNFFALELEKRMKSKGLWHEKKEKSKKKGE